MGRFNDKTVLVTGGSTGIGLAAAKLFLAEGAKVAITGRTQSTLDEAKRALGERVLALTSDTANIAELDAVYAKVAATFGGLDVLFVNAGIAKFAPVEAVTPEHYDELFAINTRGAFFAVQKALPLLRPGASIVLNTSVVGEKGYAGTAVYSATKAALRSFARTLAADLLPRGIRVNAVSPGPIATPIYGKLGLPQAHADAFAAQMREMNPMKRFGTAEEVAKAVLFFASEDSAYTTGAELVVDGGVTQL